MSYSLTGAFYSLKGDPEGASPDFNNHGAPSFNLRIRNFDMSKLQKPGEKAEGSGQYEITGPRGGGTGAERTVTKGEPLPPTPEKGQRYRFVDPTQH